MITGDHAVTAAAIGGELGIVGHALTGAQFATMRDEDILQRLPTLGVVARVAPEDKIRLVRLLQQQGHVVAMTGDGVNDAPALKKADIGVAMGITGTEVSKDAAAMILTDDNFATIVQAVEFGRVLYDNLIKYVRFQMAALVGFISTFIGAALFSIGGGIPFAPLQVLWINFAIQVPIAVALGLGTPSPGVMERQPRSLSAPVFSRAQWLRIVVLGIIMAAGTLLVRAYAEPVVGVAVALTMSMTTFMLYQISTALAARDETQTVFQRDILADRRQLALYGLALLLALLVTELGFLQGIFGTTALTPGQWLICAAVAAALLCVDEVIKFFLRKRARIPSPTPEEHTPPLGEVDPHL
jgi:Ca2+-transporting ATPase